MVIRNKNIPNISLVEHAQCTARIGGSECTRVRRGSSSRLAVPSPAQSRREAHTTHGAPLTHNKRRPPPGVVLRGTHASRIPPVPPPLVVCPAPVYAAPLTGLSVVEVSSSLTRDAACEATVEAHDVIDLGAPRRLRRTPPEPLRAAPRHLAPATYIPNPRLYPGNKPKTKPKKVTESNEQRAECRSRELRNRRSKRVFRRPVPNARLYRPAAPRAPPPPPASPHRAWPPPGQAARSLDTASHVALRFAEQRRAVRVPERPPPTPAPTAKARKNSPESNRTQVRSPLRSRRLVVTLPGAAAGDGPPRYHPTSEHFKLRELDATSRVSTPPAARPRSPATSSTMDAANRHSTSPEDCSDGNETLSAPSEFLAEFLSAIMGRQYAEALKYCQLILQYEPHNATARGFYPLLQHKVLTHAEPGREECPRDSSSESARSGRGRRAPREPRAPPGPHEPHEPHDARDSPTTNEEVMEQEADESASEVFSRSRSHSSGSCGSQSSLELDSSEPLQHSTGSHSLSISRRTDHTESGASGGSGGSGASGVSGASGASGARCSSAATDDDNGNAPTSAAAAAASLRPGDVENDNAAAPGEPHHHLKRESSSLRRLRAQFACSIK